MVKKYQKRCALCVWNNALLCGRLFCILPRCVMPAGREGHRYGKRTAPGQGVCKGA